MVRTGEVHSPAADRRENSPQPGPPSVFIVSDTRLLCEGLMLVLAQQSAVKAVGWSGLAASPARVGDAKPDVLLLDIGAPSAFDAALEFHRELPGIRIVAIAVAEVENDLIACAKAGIVGFVSREGSAEDVIAAVQSALRGELVCSPRMTALLFSRIGALSTKIGAKAEWEALTGREHEIAGLLGEGLSNK